MPSSACRRGGGEANAEARRAARLVWGDGVVSGHASVAEAKQQRPRRRPRGSPSPGRARALKAHAKAPAGGARATAAGRRPSYTAAASTSQHPHSRAASSTMNSSLVSFHPLMVSVRCSKVRTGQGAGC